MVFTCSGNVFLIISYFRVELGKKEGKEKNLLTLKLLKVLAC
jgi:hypothetical protein